VKDATGILRELTHAVAAAHDIPVVHRDLKPENVYLARANTFNSSRIVKVLDFGIAKILTGGPSTTGSLGTPMWMAPEQTDSGAKISPATDVWAIALIAFRLFTGKVFWRAAHAESGQVPILIREILSDPIPVASARAKELEGASLPEGFDEWFARCVAREQIDRYQHAREAWNALAPLVGGEPSLATKPPPPPEKSTHPEAFATTAASDPEARLTTTTGPTSEIAKPARGVAWRWWALGLAALAGAAAWLGIHAMKAEPAPATSNTSPPASSIPADVAPSASFMRDVAPSASVSAAASASASTHGPVPVHKLDAGPKIDCEKDGFTIDENGIKHYRRECLK
jgi:serine/threonine protein kinase